MKHLFGCVYMCLSRVEMLKYFLQWVMVKQFVKLWARRCCGQNQDRDQTTWEKRKPSHRNYQWHSWWNEASQMPDLDTSISIGAHLRPTSDLRSPTILCTSEDMNTKSYVPPGSKKNTKMFKWLVNLHSCLIQQGASLE